MVRETKQTNDNPVVGGAHDSEQGSQYHERP